LEPWLFRDHGVKIGFKTDFDVMTGLEDVNTVNALHGILFLNKGAICMDVCIDGMGRGSMHRRDAEIINLTEDKDFLIVVGPIIQTRCMSRIAKAHLLQFGVNVTFPEARGFGVSLECMLDWENIGCVNWTGGIPGVKPLNILVIGFHVDRGALGWWRVSKGISCISSICNPITASSDGPIKAKLHLTNTCSIGVS
jgi:hypothetical protein